MLRTIHFDFTGGDSVGGTPHSGTPSGRGILLGSQSLFADELSRCKNDLRLEMKRQKSTHEVCFPNVKLLFVPVQAESFLLGHLCPF
jgi:hypothetical protein